MSLVGGKLTNNDTIFNIGLRLTDACWNTYASTALALFSFPSNDDILTHLIAPELAPRSLPTSPAMATTQVEPRRRHSNSNSTTNMDTTSLCRTISCVPRCSNLTFTHGVRLATPSISTTPQVPSRVSKRTYRRRSRIPVSMTSTM